MRIKFFLIMAAIAASTVAAQEAADLDPFAFLAGRELSAPEAAGFEGGDVRIDVDSSRSRARVRVWDNEYESRLGRLPPVEDYTIEVHNRIKDTTKAPLYPVGDSCKKYAGQKDLTTKPTDFPAGEWKVIAVAERKDQYGPFMIKTDAVGLVDVYRGSEKIGQATDGGYALHSNTNDFSVSKSYGCIIIKQADNAKLAASLCRDADNYQQKSIPASFAKDQDCGLRQRITVCPRRER